MNQRLLCIFYFLMATIFFANVSYAAEQADPLPSWNNGPVKKSITDFVEAVTNKASHDYVAPADRIATIDNDGTLWVEQPLYTQFIFSIERFKELAPSHPEWKDNPEIAPLLTKDPKDYTSHDIETIAVLVSSNMSVEDFLSVVKQWLAKAENPRFKHHYPELAYQPMLEVLKYLQAKQFIVYIVSGGSQGFVRAFSNETYHIPVERVIGTAGVTVFSFKDNKAVITQIPKLLFVSNFTGKPEAINLIIGKKPIITFGNSDGDRQMLEWTQSSKYRHLMLLVHHDDAKREYAYDTQSKVGTFSESLMKEAVDSHWQVISMKNDWKKIFAF